MLFSPPKDTNSLPMFLYVAWTIYLMVAVSSAELRRNLRAAEDRVTRQFVDCLKGLYPQRPDAQEHMQALHSFRALIRQHGAERSQREFTKLFARPGRLSTYFNPSPTDANARAAVIYALGELRDQVSLISCSMLELSTATLRLG